MSKSIEAFAIYFPSWHPDAHYEKWYGKGFSEWELVKTTNPLFEGHTQPKIPLWGYFDESKPEWMEKQIDLAADHCITGFFFDWYWYNGEKFLDKALEDGFLKSRNKTRLKFSLMWANHTWGKWPATSNARGMGGLELGRQATGDMELLRQTHSLEDMSNVAGYCCEHYFREANYWTIDGSPVFSIYDVNLLISQFGTVESATAALEVFRETVQANGFKDVFFLANIGCCDDNLYCCGWDRVSRAAAMGFKAVFAYNIVRTPEYSSIPDEMPVYDYSGVMESHKHCWGKIEAGGLEHFPSVTIGLDVSPRWNRSIRPPMDFKAYSYEPIVVGNTPEKFGQLVESAVRQVSSNNTCNKVIILNAWNEWTEGMFLLPEKRYGNGYLEALSRKLKKTLER